MAALYLSTIFLLPADSQFLALRNLELRLLLLHFYGGSRTDVLTKVPVISIVDDDESVREATKGLIRSLGYVAATFASAEEFLQSDRLNDTACLISDVQMPGINGLELQGRLIAQGRRLPIIFITSFPAAKTRAQALAAGALGYLSKPFSDKSLIMCLDEALAIRDS